MHVLKCTQLMEILRKCNATKNDGERGGLKCPRYRPPVFSPMTLTIFEVIDTNTPVTTHTVQDLDT